MLKQLIGSLRHFSQRRKNDVKRGVYTSEFAASLVRSYADSMIKAMRMIGEEAHIATIQSEANKQCCLVCPSYKAGFKKSKKVKPGKKHIPLPGNSLPC
ncbi:hypothetical protein VA7868_00906 [Vibrio aerogenes CECT 7868]|uniref:Uncharacterized protein n=1 Tax=Vibrio aerogenes CECT 7868 TaxID=1216006 RepID=A0A1M5WXL0_9VIBR|nr:hypothetical protein [Vibrio aerogenes]SHH92088.1 hypothetical protein VA7868_00906 [Vibrio aerogenes CECT 7868]